MVVDLPFILDRRKILDERTCAQSIARICQVPFLESVPLQEISVPHPIFQRQIVRLCLWSRLGDKINLRSRNTRSR